MTTIAINEKTAQGKLLLKMLEKFKGEPYFEILSEDTSAYNQEFVAKIMKGDREAREGKVHKIETDDLWK